MSGPVKIRKIGNSMGIILGKELLEQLGVREGDLVYPIKTQGGILVTPYDETIASGMKAFARTRRKYRNALRELAK